MEARIQSAPVRDTRFTARLPSGASAAARQDHTGPLLAAVAGFAAIAINTTLVLAVRRGLPGHPLLVASLVAYATVFICCSVGIEILVPDPLRRAMSQLAAAIAVLALPIVFFGPALWLLSAVPFLAAWIVAKRGGFAAVRVQSGLLLWLAAALFCVLAVGLFGLAGYQHRELQAHFLLPEYGRLGLLHKDPLTFVTFAAEIMNGRWPGPALDGIQRVFYHFGVHAIFASFGSASGSSAFHAAMAVHQILFIPLLVYYAGLVASALARCSGASARADALSVVLCVGAILVVPARGWLNLFYSESSAATAPLTFLMLPLAAAWLGSDAGPPRAIAAALFLVAATLASAPFKISAAMTIGALTGYLVLRQLLPGRSSDLVVVVGFVLVTALALVLWPAVFGRDFVIRPRGLDAEDDAVRALYALAVIFVLQSMCRVVGRDLGQAWEVWRTLLVTFPVSVAWAWLIANEYNAYVGRYPLYSALLLTLPLIALSIAALLDAGCRLVEGRVSVARVMTAPVLAILLALATGWAMEEGRAAPSRAAATIDAAIAAMCRGAVPESTCRATTPRAFRTAPADFVATLEAGTGARILAVVKQSPVGDAFFVPPGNEAYWRFAIGGHRPFENLNFLPPHFGVPVLLGLPPAAHGPDITVVNWGLIGRYDDGARSRPLSDDELCRHARARNLGRVTVLESLEPPVSVRMLDCR
jgi:hypothetical protein